MQLTILKVVSRLILLDPANNPYSTSSVAGSISQVRSLRTGEVQTLAPSFTAAQDE